MSRPRAAQPWGSGWEDSQGQIYSHSVSQPANRLSLPAEGVSALPCALARCTAPAEGFLPGLPLCFPVRFTEHLPARASKLGGFEMDARRGGSPGGLREQGGAGVATLGVVGRSHQHLWAFAREVHCLRKKSGGLCVSGGGGEGTIKHLCGREGRSRLS